jgi:hypothetical protein
VPLELSPIVPLIAGLDAKQRETALSVGASVKRQHRTGHWTGDYVVFNVDRKDQLDRRVPQINQEKGPRIFQSHLVTDSTVIHRQRQRRTLCATPEVQTVLIRLSPNATKYGVL